MTIPSNLVGQRLTLLLNHLIGGGLLKTFSGNSGFASAFESFDWWCEVLVPRHRCIIHVVLATPGLDNAKTPILE